MPPGVPTRRRRTPISPPIEGCCRRSASARVLVHSNIYGPDNRATTDALAEMAGRFRGIALVRPEVDDGPLSGSRPRDARSPDQPRVSGRDGPRRRRAPRAAPRRARLAPAAADRPRAPAGDRGATAGAAARGRARPHGVASSARATSRRRASPRSSTLLGAGARPGSSSRHPTTAAPTPQPTRFAYDGRRAACSPPAPTACCSAPTGRTPKPTRSPTRAGLVDWLASVAGDAATVRQVLVENPARLDGFPAAGK